MDGPQNKSTNQITANITEREEYSEFQDVFLFFYESVFSETTWPKPTADLKQQ